MQFYAMVNFCNPGVLGSPSEFRRHFESPILQGREPGSTADEAQLGIERSEELSNIVNSFILRRTNALLSAHLPPKVHLFACSLQQDNLYTFSFIFCPCVVSLAALYSDDAHQPYPLLPSCSHARLCISMLLQQRIYLHIPHQERTAPPLTL